MDSSSHRQNGHTEARETLILLTHIEVGVRLWHNLQLRKAVRDCIAICQAILDQRHRGALAGVDDVPCNFEGAVAQGRSEPYHAVLQIKLRPRKGDE